MTNDRTIVGPWDGDAPKAGGSPGTPGSPELDSTLPLPRRGPLPGAQLGPYRIVRTLGEA